MKSLFEISELETFYASLSNKQLNGIYRHGAMLGFSVEDRFALSLGSPSSSGDHDWLDQKNMVKVDISISEVFCDSEGNLVFDEDTEPTNEEILNALLAMIGGTCDQIDAEYEKAEIED